MRNHLEQALADLDADLKQVRRVAGDGHRGSRYVGSGADADYARHIAEGGDSTTFDARSSDPKTVQPRAGGSSGNFAKALLDIAQHRTEGMTPVWEEKALAELTDSAGGFLLVPEIAQDVMMLIRNRVAVLNMPITHVEPRSKQYILPGLTTPGASASWLAENAAIPASAEVFEIAGSMVPRPLGALVAISNRLLADAASDNPSSAGSAQDVIQRDLADLMSVTYDLGLIVGDASGPAPKGITRVSGTTPLSGV